MLCVVWSSQSYFCLGLGYKFFHSLFNNRCLRSCPHPGERDTARLIAWLLHFGFIVGADTVNGLWSDGMNHCFKRAKISTLFFILRRLTLNRGFWLAACGSHSYVNFREDESEVFLLMNLIQWMSSVWTPNGHPTALGAWRLRDSNWRVRCGNTSSSPLWKSFFGEGVGFMSLDLGAHWDPRVLYSDFAERWHRIQVMFISILVGLQIIPYKCWRRWANMEPGLGQGEGRAL